MDCAPLYQRGARGSISRTIPFFAGLSERLQVGRQDGSTTSDDYAAPFAFTGTLKRVIVDVTGQDLIRDLVQETEIGLARQ